MRYQETPTPHEYYVIKISNMVGHILQRENNTQDFTNYYQELVKLVKAHIPDADAEELRRKISYALIDFTEILLTGAEGAKRLEKMYAQDIYSEVKPLLLTLLSK